MLNRIHLAMSFNGLVMIINLVGKVENTFWLAKFLLESKQFVCLDTRINVDHLSQSCADLLYPLANKAIY